MLYWIVCWHLCYICTHISYHDVQELPLSSDMSWTDLHIRMGICMKSIHFPKTYRCFLESSAEMKESLCVFFFQGEAIDNTFLINHLF